MKRAFKPRKEGTVTVADFRPQPLVITDTIMVCKNLSIFISDLNKKGWNKIRLENLILANGQNH